jgi:hypothetical protein
MMRKRKARRAATQTGHETEAEMSILPAANVINSRPRLQHNPELCGLDIDGQPLCSACRAEDRKRPHLTDLPPHEQERYLRTYSQLWQEDLRRRHRLPEPLSDAERDRVLRDLACYPERWQPVLLPLLLPILTGPIAEIAAAVAKEVYRGRAA